jgi:hypothetical protein
MRDEKGAGDEKKIQITPRCSKGRGLQGPFFILFCGCVLRRCVDLSICTVLPLSSNSTTKTYLLPIVGHVFSHLP